jgi:hypothetical protein
MSDELATYCQSALAGMNLGPRPLITAVAFYAAQDGAGDVSIETDIKARIAIGANDPVRNILHRALARWDFEEGASWAASTPPNSRDRRARIYDLWRVEKGLREVLELYLPPFERARAVFIDDPEAIRGWFTSEFRARYSFYSEALQNFYINVRHITPDAVNSIESAADRIVERLGDPSSGNIFAARGLVVGYVQSGKTTNFTAVIAKAIDAGYRLIIVLSGTTNLLRDQTQRRIDMDLIGRENIQRGADDDETDHDYVADEDWPDRFISYGTRPSLQGGVDIHRLTTSVDFASNTGGFNSLEFDFEKKNRNLPLFERENLDHVGARIVVIKKQQDRLKALVEDLKGMGRSKCQEVPALIIDDESDQASVNTIDPKKVATGKEDKQRTAINEWIVEILKRLPKAQYIGYTATPFANVFVNPRDPEDLYPRHFIVSLDRPAGYMGAQEFIDFDVPSAGRLSNRDAYVREVPAPKDEANDRLQEAIDAFVLSGAVKKFRLSIGSTDDDSFKNHTMLYHRSVSTEEQKTIKGSLERMWRSAGYGSAGPAMNRLRALFETDFRKVWVDRGAGQQFPSSFRELLPFIGRSLDDIGSGESPILMVNSADGADVPNFDGKAGVWKILVGGAKLSRGYTIRGLTVSYFRRASQMSDTLMQMGRWFGYRQGYVDLVRLYIGVSEKVGAKKINLYDAFKEMCRDEESFRNQLAQYSGSEGFTPLEVPALVFNSFPALRPTSRNKMFNAEITWAAFDFREPTGQAFSNKADCQHNERVFREMFRGAGFTTEKILHPAKGPFDIKWTRLRNTIVAETLEHVRWEKSGNRVEAEVRYLKEKNVPVDSWVIIAPQLKEVTDMWTADAQEFSCISRSRVGDSRFGIFSAPEHVDLAKWLVGSEEIDIQSDALRPAERTGVLLFYPTWQRKEGKPVKTEAPAMGFVLVLPQSGRYGRRIAWRVKSS